MQGVETCLLFLLHGNTRARTVKMNKNNASDTFTSLLEFKSFSHTENRKVWNM